MPQWAHLPLILGPNGKLSKRDGAKFGFPVFAMNWTDPKTKEITEGFKEKGFLPEAFINFLALLGWNDGTEQEIFTKEELIGKFSIERVHSGGAKFDYEKARWFNHEWIKKSDVRSLKSEVRIVLNEKGITGADDALLEKVIILIKDRCTLLTDFYDHSYFFFKTPDKWDVGAVKPKWTEGKLNFFIAYIDKLSAIGNWQLEKLEESFKILAAEMNIKPGELQLPLRVMLVGGKFGPPVFNIAEILGKNETIHRIKKALAVF
jgi:glutamyl-tRNA synthetase